MKKKRFYHKIVLKYIEILFKLFKWFSFFIQTTKERIIRKSIPEFFKKTYLLTLSSHYYKKKIIHALY